MNSLLYRGLAFALLLACSCSAKSGPARVTVAYHPTLDTVCSVLRGSEIKEEWRSELSARRGEFEALTSTLTPRFIAATEAITGKAFPEGPFTVYLTLCDVPSQSKLGVSVNMRYALASFTASPVPLRYKVDTLLHELLHRFIASHPPRSSALLEAHRAETQCIRDHLHLLALQKAVLLKLGDRDALEKVIEVDSQLPGGCYKRAWALVNATEAEHARYVAELAAQ